MCARSSVCGAVCCSCPIRLARTEYSRSPKKAATIARITTTVTIPPKFGCPQHRHVSPRFQMPIVGLSNRPALLLHCPLPRPLLIARFAIARRGLCAYGASGLNRNGRTKDVRRRRQNRRQRKLEERKSEGRGKRGADRV